MSHEQASGGVAKEGGEAFQTKPNHLGGKGYEPEQEGREKSKTGNEEDCEGFQAEQSATKSTFRLEIWLYAWHQEQGPEQAVRPPPAKLPRHN